ncbi:MAG: hypothetical protein ACKV2V_29325 [Blastocatellia bacterium]
MVKNTNIKLDVYRHVLIFGETAQAQLANETYALALLAQLAAVVARLWECDGRRADGRTDVRAAYDKRAAARTVLRDSLRAIQRTAQGMSQTVPDVAGIFSMPASLNDHKLVEVARNFLDRGAPLAAEFTRRAMPADFLTELRANLTAFENTDATQRKSRSTQMIAGVETRNCLAEGDRLLAELKVIMANKFADDKGMLRTWNLAVRPARTRARAAAAENDGEEVAKKSEKE